MKRKPKKITLFVLTIIVMSIAIWILDKYFSNEWLHYHARSVATFWGIAIFFLLIWFLVGAFVEKAAGYKHFLNEEEKLKKEKKDMVVKLWTEGKIEREEIKTLLRLMNVEE